MFGAGMVLAGGCVSGTLFKTGQGNLNSMAALVAIPLGVAAVEYGPFRSTHLFLRRHVISNDEGGSVTLSSVTGAPYWLLALIIAAATIVLAFVISRRRRAVERHSVSNRSPELPLLTRLLTRPWKPWQSGIAIGILAFAAYISSAASGRNYPLGVTHGVLHVELLATETSMKHVWQKKPVSIRTEDKGAAKPTVSPGSQAPSKKVVWWLVALVTFLVVGSHISARLRNNVKLVPKPPDETIVAFFGGLMVGVGAAFAGGCVVGNIMSGIALMSVGNLFFLFVVVLANWVTTYFYLMGAGSRKDRVRTI
jgi:uncharacterized membrane protein YedE/YeeE